MDDIYCGERELAKAVILRAVEDAGALKDSLDRKQARLFLCAKNELWKRSLSAWCDMAGWEMDHIIRFARKKWGNR